MDVFKTHISIFEKFGGKPMAFTLHKWINICRNGCRYSDQILKYRETGDTQYKNSLPFVTVGAVCEGGRKLDNVVTRTGWIALDIDSKDNRHIKDAEALRDELQKIVYVAFAGLSASGKGVWCLVKVSNPDRQDEHFEQLQTDFKSIGIKLDSTKGKNPHDVRYYSYDPNAWNKPDFKIYNRLPVKKPKPSHAIRRTSYTNDTRSDVEALIEQIQSQRIDITPGYHEWLKIGFALSEQFGEAGREYFHAVSQFHPDYREREADRQYTHCQKGNGQGVTISSFFYLCKQYGIQLQTGDGYPSSQKDRSSQGKYESRNSGNLYKTPIQAGYPTEWDKVNKPEPGSQEDIESARAAVQDAEPNELQELMQNDPVLKDIVEIFDCELAQN